jgi:pyridoxine 5-phosphate synthase
MPKLGVNIDHIATVRQARRGLEPDPVWAAVEAELGGAQQITVHLREDRRHIQERDVLLLLSTVQTRVNLEMAINSDVVRFAVRHRPQCACLVPEKREEVTTEGGLDVAGALEQTRDTVKRLSDAGIIVSLFIDPDERQVAAAAQTGAPFIELHTGRYANAVSEAEVRATFTQLEKAVSQAVKLGLRVNAGHGLNYRNVKSVAALPKMEELNIGHAIISRALFTGMRKAVREMVALVE